MKTRRRQKHDREDAGKPARVTTARRDRTETVRQCAVTRERRPIGELIRFVLDPDNRVVADLRHRLPGRGVWLTGSQSVVSEAIQRKAFPRAFKAAVVCDSELPEKIADLLIKSALADLSLANKAGALVLGFSKIEAMADDETVVALVQASDASADGRRKLAGRFAARRNDQNEKLALITHFKVEELSLALGRANVVHAALVKGGAAAKFVASVARLDAYRVPAMENAVDPDRGVGEV